MLINLMTPRRTHLIFALWLRLSLTACSRRVSSRRLNPRSSGALLDSAPPSPPLVNRVGLNRIPRSRGDSINSTASEPRDRKESARFPVPNSQRFRQPFRQQFRQPAADLDDPLDQVPPLLNRFGLNRITRSRGYSINSTASEPREGKESARLRNIKGNLWGMVKPGSKCIADSKPYDWNSFTLCCEGLRPCEQVYGNDGQRTRFFMCLKDCIPNFFEGQGSSEVRKLIGSQFADVYKDLSLTRFLSNYDEKIYNEVSAVKPKIKILSVRPYDYGGKPRFASPFEHICGGNAMTVSRGDGNDGPTQFISFTNTADRSRRKKQECTAPFDKGQRRIKTGSKEVLDRGGIVVDVSNEYKAFKWCYDGGCVHAGKSTDSISKHTQLCFAGARTANPWPFACASRAFQVKMKRRSGTVPDEWWTEENRVEIAKSCATWAVRATEVLLLPYPKTFANLKLKKYIKGTSTKITVITDRHPATEQCNHSDNEDRCTSYDPRTHTVCCSKTSFGGVAAAQCKTTADQQQRAEQIAAQQRAKQQRAAALIEHRNRIAATHRCCCSELDGSCLWYDSSLLTNTFWSHGHCPRLRQRGVLPLCAAQRCLFFRVAECSKTHESKEGCAVSEDPQHYFQGESC